MRRVFVRGIGAVTPLGAWPEARERLAAGETAVGPVDTFDATGFPCTVAASVREPFEAGERADPEDRRLSLARRAAERALADAGMGVGAEAALAADPVRIGVFVGAESGRARMPTILALARAAGGGKIFDHALFGERARSLATVIGPSSVSPAAVASVLAGAIGARGPAQTVSLACASSASAIVDAVRAIRQGVCDAALAGGVGADVDPMMLAGFGLLSALSARGTSCPFDAHRDGFVVGEGAAMVVLSAEQGDARCEIAGVGRSLDAYHLTAPDPEGRGAERSMRAALDDAKVSAVDYVQAHGTSTPLNDAVEAAAIRRVLGPALARAHVSSIKGALGHWVAGAGALGLLAAIEAVARGRLLPTAGLRRPDPACDLPHVMGSAIERDVDLALVNAFAFGGANASLVVRRA